MKILTKYYHWLHGQWPAGTVEKLPEVGEDGLTNVDGVRIVGDLSGVPLLKFSSDTGAKAVHAILKESDFASQRSSKADDVVDVAIIGGGVSGFSAAMEAKKAGLSYVLFESSEAFSTIVNFPKRKPIYTYPTDMVPEGGVQYGDQSDVKESLLEDIRRQVEEVGVDVTKVRIDHLKRKDGLIHLLHADKEKSVTKALRCVVAIGRSGNYRKLGVPGEQLDKVSNRLHDPKEYKGKDVLVVGGGDSAAEAAIALAEEGATVTLSYRKPELTRPKPENIQKVQSMDGRGINLRLGTNIKEITEGEAVLEDKDGESETFDNAQVFSLIGREAPLDFFRRSGISIANDRNTKWWVTISVMLLLMIFVYHWKKTGTWLPLGDLFAEKGWFPYGLPSLWSSFGAAFSDPQHILGVAKKSLGEPGFYYSFLYCAAMLIFGIKRIKRRRTPYVTRQTYSLLFFQLFMLFILPYYLLPWAGNNGVFGDRVRVESFAGDVDVEQPDLLVERVFPDVDVDVWGEPEIQKDHWAGLQVVWPNVNTKFTVNSTAGLAYLQDDRKQNFLSRFTLLPPCEYGFGREYWRSFGFVLAWPLFVFNWFTDAPLWGWLILGAIQTFVIIPFIVKRWGKGAYCGWICSCGGLAETMGDAHRHKMPHGPFWNKMNMIGQAFLWIAGLMMLFRVLGWVMPGSFFGSAYKLFLYGGFSGKAMPWSYVWFVDLLWAGILGLAFYFHFSGRIWCRFACPLAALMHIYAKFSKFRIFSEKSKCISCNVCTSVCHQGIDIMNFANKGKPMEDPECVRCSACVQQCPTGVLSFGRYDENGVTFLDNLPASPVQIKEMREKRMNK